MKRRTVESVAGVCESLFVVTTVATLLTSTIHLFYIINKCILFENQHSRQCIVIFLHNDYCDLNNARLFLAILIVNVKYIGVKGLSC